MSRFSALAEMKIIYPQWNIRSNEALHVWCAERQEGTMIRLIVAHSLDQLADKLAEANATS